MYLSTTVINFPFLLLSSAAAELLVYVSNGSSYADPPNRWFRPSELIAAHCQNWRRACSPTRFLAAKLASYCRLITLSRLICGGWRRHIRPESPTTRQMAATFGW